MNKNNEEIIVCLRTALFDEQKSCCFSGFLDKKRNPEVFSELMKKIKHEKIWFTHKRGEVEDDPQYLQPIPYILLRQKNQLFGYRRLKASGEQRLYGCYSVGWGGHMNSHESDYFLLEPQLADNIVRELLEETTLTADHVQQPLPIVGFIHFDHTPVSRVHFGIVLQLDLPVDLTIAVNPQEASKLEGFWFTQSTLEQVKPLEEWSEAVKKFAFTP